MNVVPITLREACAFVSLHHRHHQPPRGCVFSIGAAKDDVIVGVAIVGRPVARMNQDGLTCEVTRLATDGTRNACSFLYARAWRIAQAMGYRRMVTYTHQTESGASLRAVGWRLIGEVAKASWHRGSRPRVDKHPMQERFAWEVKA